MAVSGLRILTVRQPWAWAIIHGGKDIENRGRNIAGDYRGPVAIHAAKAWDGHVDDHDASWEIRRAITSEQKGWPADDGEVWASDVLEPADPRYVYSAIIGVVDLVDVHRVIETGGRAHCETVTPPRDPAMSGACSPWADRDAHHLVLANPRPLAEPIPYRGALGLRRVDDDLAARVLGGVS